MPTELGDFISKNVYSSKLNSVHTINGWNCLKFVDVWNGIEEQVGKSWKVRRTILSSVVLKRMAARRTRGKSRRSFI